MTDGRDSPAFRVLSDVVLAMAGEREVEPVLQRLVHAARELGGARYAALGVPDGEGAFARFITSGMSEELIEAMGPLPRTHGLLGAMLEGFDSHRTADIQADPRFRGWWPRGHPDMRSFLGVPIVAHEGVIGAFYLTEKLGEPVFGDEDVELIQVLAAHAAIAIEKARLYERSRELSIAAERNRLALELHDVVSQKLFGLVLSAEAAATLLDRDPAAAKEQVTKVGGLAREALDELRSLVFELRPPDLERDGLAEALRKHVEVLRRLYEREISLDAPDGLAGDPERDLQVLRIAEEALANALRHANAEHVAVSLDGGPRSLVLQVVDDGAGFDPSAAGLRSRRLGLTSMEERARRLGGRLEIRSEPGRGTAVRLEAPGG